MKPSRKHLISDLAHKAAKDLHLLRNITQQAPALLSQNAQSIKDLFDMVELRLSCINHQALKGVKP